MKIYFVSDCLFYIYLLRDKTDLGYDVGAVPLYQGISVPKMFKKAFRT